MKAKKEGELSFLDVKCMVREFEGAIDEMMSEFTKKTGWLLATKTLWNSAVMSLLR